ncbi:MAG: hypothetical protein QXI69_02035 [Candidatus Nitrosocaldus sp.]
MDLIPKYKKELQKFGLTPDYINKVFEVLRTIYAGQCGYYGAIFGYEFDESTKSESNILSQLHLIYKGGTFLSKFNYINYICTNEGNRLASELWKQYISVEEHKLWSVVRKYPKKLVAFWLKYVITFGSRPSSPILMYSKSASTAIAYDILKNQIINESILNLCKDLVENGFAVISIDSVSTRGGELRDRQYCMPREVATTLHSAYTQVNIDMDECKLYHLLLTYSNYNWTKEQFVEELNRSGLSEDKIRSAIEKTAKLGITSNYTDSSLIPFLINDIDAYRNYLIEKYNHALKDIINNILYE